MPVSLRLLAAVCRGFHWLGLGRWLLALPLISIGLVKLVVAGLGGAGWWLGPALGLLVVGKLAEEAGYMFFVEADLSEGRAPAAVPAVIAGLATGWFRSKDGYRWLEPERMDGAVVQVRWLQESGEPPALALIQPADLPEKLYSPLEECYRAALWYPGVSVRAGWVTVGWRVYPGLRLEYIGRTLTLALDSSAEAEALAGALREAA